MRIDTIFKHTNKTLPNVLVYFIRISLDLLSGKFSQRYHGPDWEFKKKKIQPCDVLQNAPASNNKFETRNGEFSTSMAIGIP